jgi:hypothetical protein
LSISLTHCVKSYREYRSSITVAKLYNFHCYSIVPGLALPCHAVLIYYVGLSVQIDVTSLFSTRHCDNNVIQRSSKTLCSSFHPFERIYWEATWCFIARLQKSDCKNNCKEFSKLSWIMNCLMSVGLKGLDWRALICRWEGSYIYINQSVLQDSICLKLILDELKDCHVISNWHLSWAQKGRR